MPIQNWDDVRIFAAVARHGRLAAGARSLGLDHSTVTRRITSLEAQLGTQLLLRSPTGAALTEAGTALLEHAERIEGETHAAEQRLGRVDRGVTGAVRLATPEALGSGLIAPHVGALRASHPGIQLELVADSRAVSITKREADMAVTLAPPAAGRLFTRRLTDYRLRLYASADYMAKAGPVETLRALPDHPFVWYIDGLIDLPELRYLDQVVADARTVFRSNSLAAQREAVAAGMGIGMLHGFIAGADPRLVPVLADVVSVTRSYWLVLHADQRMLPRIRAVVDFLDALITAESDRFL